MKKIIVAIAMIPLFLAPALLAQGKIITPVVPGADKITFIGGTMYYAGSPYLSISAHLTKGGVPVLHGKVRMNGILLRESSDGFYAGSIPTPFHAEIGQEQVFTIAPALVSRTITSEQVVLATYRVDNLIQWLSPTPGQVIDLAAYPLGELPCRWNYRGRPVMARLRVVDTATRAEVFSRMTDGEELTIPTAALSPGKTYSVRIDTSRMNPGCGPLGRFKLAKLAAPDSDVRFDQDYSFTFSTAPAK